MSYQIKIVRVFLNTNISNGHVGLREIAQKQNVNMNILSPEECLVFINKTKDKIKFFHVNQDMISYLRLPKNRPFVMETLSFIPKVYNPNAEVMYSKAVKEVLKGALPNNKT